MTRYPKTPNIFKRDETTHKLMPHQWREPEFEYLKNNQWHFTEKLDGTNMRLIYNPESIRTKHEDCPSGFSLWGRSDGATVHGNLKTWAEQWSAEMMHVAVEVFHGVHPVCIYGEGVGAGIQKGGDQYGATHFRAFAIKVGDWWLQQPDVDDICRSLHLRQVPHIMTGTLMDGVAMVKKGLRTMIGSEPGTHFAEGLIGVPDCQLLNPSGERIICKITHKDIFNG